MRDNRVRNGYYSFSRFPRLTYTQSQIDDFKLLRVRPIAITHTHTHTRTHTHTHTRTHAHTHAHAHTHTHTPQNKEK
jgi:hypothetical protein